jgi:hypothetical protein
LSPAGDPALWKPLQAVRSPNLDKLLGAWQEWARADGGVPRRGHFDPFEFPPLLPLMVLAEIIAEPNSVRPYDVLYRYIGSDFSTFFDSARVTRARLSQIGAPFDERWFAISDAVIAARAPCYFAGSPFGTAYSHVALEMLALPLARDDAPAGEIGFVLCALSRVFEEI